MRHLPAMRCVVGITTILAGTACSESAMQPPAEQARLQRNAVLKEQLKALRQTEEPGDVRALRQKADHGDADAQYELGVSYREGTRVDRDYVQAVNWWRRAAAAGHANAQGALGFMYANGQGVSEDDAQAAAWYREAAEQGVARAQFNLGVMYAKGRGVPQDRVAAYMWTSLAAALPESAAARDRLAQEMTPTQIAEAERRAREWTAAIGKRKR